MVRRPTGSFAQPGHICIHCEETGPRFEHAAAYGEYEDALRGLIHLLKYQGVRPAARPLGQQLAQAIRLVLGQCEVRVCMVPVPSASSAAEQPRLQPGGTDCARRPARAPRSAGGICTNALERTRFTESQTGFTREQRREKLRGAFAVPDPPRFDGRSVLLVDDVLTTGATADECSRILLRAGAKQVLVVTVARAVTLDGVAAATKTCSVLEASARETASV